MSVLLLTHEAGLAHLTPPGHPERTDRLAAINAALASPRFDWLLREEAPLGTREDVLLAHPARHFDRIAAASPKDGLAQLDPDTWMSLGSLEAALRAVGGCLRGVEAVLSGEARRAFVAMRPPGHHAEGERPMGFCLFGSVAIAAKAALERHGLERVAIVDFDVHHGNGTQALLWDEPRILFVSTHQMPLYPGTGARDERGAHDQIVNVPLDPGTGSAVFRRVCEGEVLPAIDAYAPQLILVSAGFDAHKDDPLANLALSEDDFGWITSKLVELAEKHCEGRIVSSLEGGYDLPALAASVAAHLEALKGKGE